MKILRLISRIAFVCMLLLFVSALFTKPPMSLFLPLFLTAVVSEVLYQVFSGKSMASKIKQKKSEFKKLPSGQYKITEIKTKTDLGELSHEAVDFLRGRFLEQGMDDNDFLFLLETLELFYKEENPTQELREFLDKAMKNKTAIELHWEPI